MHCIYRQLFRTLIFTSSILTYILNKMMKLAEAKKVDSEQVKVVVRVRPFSEKELQNGKQTVVNVDTKRNEITLTKTSVGTGRKPGCSSSETESKPFTFDGVFDNSVHQADIYRRVFHRLVDSVLEGFNGTIFAYGQTGTGKTWTMEGSCENEELYGVMPNSFQHIFNHISEHSSKRYLVRASYLEIYQEEIRDLLSNGRPKKCGIREGHNGLSIKDLSTYLCSDFKQICDLMVKGNKMRAVGATNMNEHSSRSHAIFQITIETSDQWDDNGEHIRVGKLNLVDLAGSERTSKTGAEGERLKEATKINLSLSTLGNVISALVDGASHIPYRDSKLTRLLQDSLGGNSRTIMVATVGPAAFNYDETLNTLRYASRAKNIKNKPRINENPKDTVLRFYQDEINRLRKLVAERKSQRITTPRGSVASSCDENENEDTDLDTTSNEHFSMLQNVESCSNQQNSMEFMEDSKIKQLTELLEPYGIKFEGNNIAEIQAQLKIRKESLMKDNQILKEDKEKLLSKLQHATDEIKSAESECINLMTQIQWLETKVLNSSGKKSLLQKMKSQEKEIEMKEKELEDQKHRQDELRISLMEKQLTFEETLSTLNAAKDEFQSKMEKIIKTENKMGRLGKEASKLKKEHEENLNQLHTCIEEIKKELKLKRTLADNFIPRAFQKAIDQRIRYDDAKDAYFVEPLRAKWVQPIPIDRMMLYPMFNCTRFKKLSPTSGSFFTNENLLLLEPELPRWKAKHYVPDKMNPRVEILIKEAMKDIRNAVVINCDLKKAMKYKSMTGEPPAYTAVGPNLLLRKVSSEKYLDFSCVPSDVSLPRGSNITTIHVPMRSSTGRKLTPEELLALPLITVAGEINFEEENQPQLTQPHSVLNESTVIGAGMVVQDIPLAPSPIKRKEISSKDLDFRNPKKPSRQGPRTTTALRPKHEMDDWVTKTQLDYELEQMEKDLLKQSYSSQYLQEKFQSKLDKNDKKVLSRIATARPESRKGQPGSSRGDWTALNDNNESFDQVTPKKSYYQEIIKQPVSVRHKSSSEEDFHRSLGDFLGSETAAQMPHLQYSIGTPSSFTTTDEPIATDGNIGNAEASRENQGDVSQGPLGSESKAQVSGKPMSAKLEPNPSDSESKEDSDGGKPINKKKLQKIKRVAEKKSELQLEEYPPVPPCRGREPKSPRPPRTKEQILSLLEPHNFVKLPLISTRELDIMTREFDEAIDEANPECYGTTTDAVTEDEEDNVSIENGNVSVNEDNNVSVEEGNNVSIQDISIDDWNEVTMNTHDFSDSETSDSLHSNLTEDGDTIDVNKNRFGTRETNWLSTAGTEDPDFPPDNLSVPEYSNRPPTRPSSHRRANPN